VKGPDFKRWRKLLGWSQKLAAEKLGLKRRVVQYYEKGERGDKQVKIPRTVRLACYALTLGIEDYAGPPKLKDREDFLEPDEKPAEKPKRKRKASGDAETGV
jgi:transcriptional regulator with XRE-family HTH domain